MRERLAIVAPFDLLQMKAGGVTRILSDIEALSFSYDLRIVLPTSRRAANAANKANPAIQYHPYANLRQIPILPEKFGILSDMYSQFLNPSFILAYRSACRGCKAVVSHFPQSFIGAELWRPKSLPHVFVSHDFEYGLARQVTTSTILRGVIRRLERFAVTRSVRVLAVSKTDIDHLASEYAVEKNKFDYIPNTVSIPAAPRPSAAEREALRSGMGFGPADVVAIYHANFGVVANREALRFIRAELVPEIERQRADGLRILIVGASIPKDCVSNETISYFSNVPDIWPYLYAADVEIVPLSIGGGTRLKILEAFHAKLPVISTAKGIEGIEFEPGRHALLAEQDAVDFVEKLLTVKRDPVLAKHLSENGHALFREQYSSAGVRDQYRAIIERL